MNRTLQVWRINVVVAPRSIRMLATMDVADLREKAALCLRIARGLSWNNPGRLQFTDLAERFESQAKELELQKVSNLSAPNLPQLRA